VPLANAELFATMVVAHPRAFPCVAVQRAASIARGPILRTPISRRSSVGGSGPPPPDQRAEAFCAEASTTDSFRPPFLGLALSNLVRVAVRAGRGQT
jgi:hypothetical protein